MSFLEHLVSQEKSGSITKKDALDMKMNYLSLNQKERDELDGQYSFNKKTEASVAKKIKVNPEKKTTKKKLVAKKINKANVFSEKLLVNFMKGISPNNYELIFDSYYVFLKNKFGQNKEVDDIIEAAAEKQLRGGQAEKFYNEYINRKVKENSNYDKQIDSEIRQKVLHPKKKTKKVSSVNRSGLPKGSFYNNFWNWVIFVSIFFIFCFKCGVFENNISYYADCVGNESEILSCYKAKLERLKMEVIDDASDGAIDDYWGYEWSLIVNPAKGIINDNIRYKVHREIIILRNYIDSKYPQISRDFF
jgi:hypothetical protein